MNESHRIRAYGPDGDGRPVLYVNDVLVGRVITFPELRKEEKPAVKLLCLTTKRGRKRV